MEATTVPPGEFSLSCQHKLAKEERCEPNGTVKEVHVVIKQCPFTVTIFSQTVSLERCTVKSTLVYDNERLDVCARPH